MGIHKSIVLHRQGLATLKEHCLDQLLAFYQHPNNHNPKFWLCFPVVCGGLPAFHCFHYLSSQILVVVWRGLRWFEVVYLIVIPVLGQWVDGEGSRIMQLPRAAGVTCMQI